MTVIPLSEVIKRRKSFSLARSAHVDSTLTSSQSSDNDDICSACRQPGFLVVCDSCERAFHFLCHDPPISPTNPDLDFYYCTSCAARHSAGAENFGVFGALLDILETRNPVNFSLPASIRNHFEGVKTGSAGQYLPTNHWRKLYVLPCREVKPD